MGPRIRVSEGGGKGRPFPPGAYFWVSVSSL